MRQIISIKTFFLLCGFCLLSSCNKVDLMYSWSENYLVYELDDYFDFTSKQEEKIKTEFKKRLNGFLVEKESDIIQFIQDYRLLMVERKIEKFPELSQRGRDWFSQFATWILPLSLEVLQELSDEQMTQFKNQFAKRIQKETKRDEVKVLRGRLERWMEWIGFYPTTEQKKLVSEFAEKKLFPFELQREHSLKLLERFFDVWKKPAEQKAFLEQLSAKAETLRSPAYQEAMQNYQTAQFDLQKTLIQSLSEHQKKSIADRLDQHQKTIQNIIDRVKKNTK